MKKRLHWIIWGMVAVASPGWSQDLARDLLPMATATDATAFATPGLGAVLGLFSPTRDEYLTALYPKLDVILPLEIDTYSWDRLPELELAGLPEATSAAQKQKYERALATLQQIAADDPLREEKQFLKADLQLVLWRGGESDRFALAQAAYDDALKNFPDSRLAPSAHYHLGLLLLEQRDHLAVSMLAHRETARLKKDARWVLSFRALVMENYYRAGRYVRGEAYMWELARQMEREELTGHLALRYGDSLFWGGHYDEVIDWYEKMQVFLEGANTPAGQMSQLYYAESLFMVGKTALAELAYTQFERKFTGEYPRLLVAYRHLQCALAEGLTSATTGMQQLVGLSRAAGDRLLAVAVELTWIRLAIRTDDKKLQNDAQVRMFNLRDESTHEELLPAPVQREVILVDALLKWRLRWFADAITAARTVASYHYAAERRVREAGANVLALLLIDLAPIYFSRDDQVGFLVLADRLRDGIERSGYQSYILPWVARAYVEVGMTGAGARLYQRILFDLSLTPDQKDLIALELARSYSLLGKTDLLKKTLSLVNKIPDDPRGRHLYYLTYAARAVLEQRYGDCVQQCEQLLKEGVRGNELFAFAIAGAQCARLAKNYGAAMKFVGMVIPDHDKIAESSGDSPAIVQWQAEAIYEKIAILVGQGDHQAATGLFEQVQGIAQPPKPPLYAVFSLVESYRAQHLPEKAAHVWATFGGTDEAIPPDANVQYGKLLELLSQKELLPQPAEQSGN